MSETHQPKTVGTQRRKNQGERPPHPTVSGGTQYPQDLLLITSACTRLFKVVSPRLLRSKESIFLSAHSTIKSKLLSSAHTGRGRLKFCLLEGGVPKNLWVSAKNPPVINRQFRVILGASANSLFLRKAFPLTLAFSSGSCRQ